MSNILKIVIAAFALTSCAIIFLYESHCLPEGIFADKKQSEFIVLTCMEILTICTIPLALRLFKFKSVKRSLDVNGIQAVQKWGIIRIVLLTMPMTLNILLFYLFGNVAFGYMAIILFLSLFFIYPTKNRCQSEIEK